MTSNVDPAGRTRFLSLAATLDEYVPCWSEQFAEEFGRASQHHTGLDEISLDLELAWKSYSYAASMPYIFVHAYEQYCRAFTTSIEPVGSIISHSDVILKLLSERIPEVAVSPTLQRKIQTELVQIASRVRAAKTSSAELVGAGFTPAKAWRDFIETPAFQISVRASVQLAFIGFWNAYEEFLVHATKIALTRDSLRASHKGFPADLDLAFGDGAAEKLWCNEDLEFCRELRNSFAHAGGRITKALQKFGPLERRSVPVTNGRIDVHPSHIRNLYASLQPCVLLVCRADCFKGA